MKEVTALRRKYLSGGAYPIAIKTISGDASPQHEGDLTDIRHSHDFCELVIITEGYGIHWIDGEDYPVTAGDIFVIQGKTAHYFKERHKLCLFNVMFEPKRLGRNLQKLQEIAGYNALFLLEPAYRRRHKFKSRLHIARHTLIHVETIVKRMVEEYHSQQPGYDTMLLSFFMELLVFLSREYSMMEIPQAKSLYRIGNIIGELEKHYKRNWQLDEIARFACMSKSNLLTVFKEATGQSPIEYLIRIRLQKAAGMLISTPLSIGEIAPECGFADSNYLTRQFRKVYKISPREFRKKSLVNNK